MATNTQQPLGPVSTVCELGSQTLPDGTIDQLADALIQNERGFVNYALTAIALKKKLDAAPRDRSNRLITPVKGCYSFKEFCKKHLGRTREAVYKQMRLLDPKALAEGEKKKKQDEKEQQSAWDLRFAIRMATLATKLSMGLAFLCETSVKLPKRKPSVVKLKKELESLAYNVQSLLDKINDPAAEGPVSLKKIRKGKSAELIEFGTSFKKRLDSYSDLR